MRINTLRFKNINALKGEWKIDFRAEPFASNGVFAITGATGAGKTTILDAICLALYHETPRLKKISANGNECMTLHTAECFAEVEFEVKGKTYRSFFSQRRARLQVGGKLQGPQVELAEVSNSKILTTKINDKLQLIAEITGLDFGRFTKSMLLSQGQFARFLNADPNERAGLLEELTGTEVYTKVSMYVFERQKETKQQLELREEKLKMVSLLTAEERHGLEAQQQECLEQDLELQQQLKIKSEEENWLLQLKLLFNKQEQQRQQQQLATRNAAKAQPQLDRLAAAEPAEKCRSCYDQKVRLEGDLDEAQKQQTTRRGQHNQLVQQTEHFEKEMQALETSLTLAKKTQQENDAHIEKTVLPLDQSILQLSDKQANLDQLVLQSQRSEEQAREELKTKELELEKQQLEFRSLQKQLDGPASGEDLNRECVRWRSELSRAEDVQNELKQEVQQREKYQKKALEHQQNIANAEKKLAKAQRDLGQAKEEHSHHEKLLLNSCQVPQAFSDDESSDGFCTGPLKLLEEVPNYLQNIKEKHNALNASAQVWSQLPNLCQQQATRSAEIQQQREQLLSCERSKKIIEPRSLSKQQELLAKQSNLETLNQLVQREQQIVSLEAERAQLQASQPCPLCGSLEHPAVKTYQTIDISINQQKQQEANLQVEALKSECTELKEELQLQNNKIIGLQDNIKRLHDQMQVAQQQWQRTVAPLGPNHGLRLDNSAGVNTYLEEQQQRLAVIGSHVELIQATDERRQSSLLKLADLEKQEQAEASQLKWLNAELESDRQHSARCAEKVEQLQHEQLQLCENVALSMEKKRFSVNTTINAELEILKLALVSFQKQADLLSECLKKWTVLDKQIDVLTSQTQGCMNEVTKRADAVSKNMIEQKGNREQLMAAQEQRLSWFDGTDIGSVRQRDKKAITAAEIVLRSEQKHQASVKEELGNSLGQITVAQQNIEQLLKQKTELSADFEDKLKRSPFSDLETFLAALMPEDEQLKLQKLKQQLDQELKSVAALLNQNQQELTHHHTQRPPSLAGDFQSEDRMQILAKQLEQVVEKSSRLRELGQQNQRRLGELKLQLDKDCEAHEQQKHLLLELEQQRQSHDDWSHLNGLIGSADGAKFRKFAQGLTLDHLVDLANRQLNRLHGRYLLKRKSDNSLELMVLDTWQADAERDTKTLSGGESFIVSLSLALALSDLVSHKTSIDSLFLDEGFGTLDPDMLNMALDALDALNASGKMIGVISHVEALKERIPVQIQIDKSNGLGVSRMDSSYAVH